MCADMSYSECVDRWNRDEQFGINMQEHPNTTICEVGHARSSNAVQTVIERAARRRRTEVALGTRRGGHNARSTEHLEYGRAFHRELRSSESPTTFDAHCRERPRARTSQTQDGLRTPHHPRKPGSGLAGLVARKVELKVFFLTQGVSSAFARDGNKRDNALVNVFQRLCHVLVSFQSVVLYLALS